MGDVVTAFDGDTKSLDTLEENAVFNLIHKLQKDVHLIPAKPKPSGTDDLIAPSEISKKFFPSSWIRLLVLQSRRSQ